MTDKNIYYNGNRNLKKAGVQQDFTAEQIQEYVKCSQDPIYFIETYCKIVTLDHGIQPFKLFDYQKKMIRAFHENRFIINLLPRQSGKSTICCGFFSWYVIFHQDKTVGLLAQKAGTAREILSRIKLMIEKLPLWLQPGIVEWNKGSVEFGNGSSLIAESTSSESVRGFSFNIVYLDEFAHVHGQAEFYEATYPVVSSGDTTKVIITSTPNGMDLFHKIYTEAEQGINDFIPIRVDWWEHPKRDEKWKETTLRNMDEEQFRQEYGNEFLGSSGTLISGSVLQRLVHKMPIHESYNLKVYEQPKPDHTYVAVCDVSRGKGLDYSAFSIIDVTDMPYNQVLVFKDNTIGAADYSDFIYQITKQYNDGHILVEVNDNGQQVADILHMDLEAENVIWTENKGRSGKRVSSGFGVSPEKGIRTTKSVKSIGCNILKNLIEQNQLIINDHYTIEELSTFSKSSTSYAAEAGKHDDIVMGLVLFAWLSTQGYFRDITDINTIDRLREKTNEQIMDQIAPFLHMDQLDDVDDDFTRF